ncbi:cuticle protein 18.7-like [Atheta coriaria]|uniref:cuticle protein 18.7-like n=1 Tax=Dalotia coriaria TaxID=877792 RepID=UPI0031F387AC
MKFLIVFVAALAAASAGYVAPVAPLVYGAQHLPVIGPNGVPIDTPAVQHATAAHLAHKAEAHARNGDYAVYAHAAPVVAHAAPLAYAHHAYAAPVVAAHAAHGVVGHVGVAETPEVVAAKHAHFAAHAEALARVAPVHHLYRRGIYAAAPAIAAYAAPIAYAAQHLPVIGPNGVPVDTAEVQHARAAHFAHKAEAHARNGDYLAHPVVSAAYGAYPYAYGAYPYAHGAHHLGYAHYL